MTKADGFDVDYGEAESNDLLQPLSAGQLYGIKIHPYDPTVSVSTNYKILFTSEHSIPSGSIIEIEFPSAINPSSISSCASYIAISSSLQCTESNNKVTITGGFPFELQGSVMIGVTLNSIQDPSSAGVSSSFTIKTLTSS